MPSTSHRVAVLADRFVLFIASAFGTGAAHATPGIGIRSPAAASPRFRLSVLVAVLLLGASKAWALPTIRIMSPAPGQALYEVQPTITVVYSTDAAPLDLNSLRIVVHGADWTAKFTKDPTSASYAVTTGDSLIAGTLSIEASIHDEAGGVASASQTYEVFPTLKAISADNPRAGTPIILEVLGLDPDPLKSLVTFTTCVQRPFATVDRLNNRGTVVVPAEALFGDVTVTVNGRPAREKRRLALPAPVEANYHSLLVDEAGALWTWGPNDYGQLALGFASLYQTVPSRTAITNVREAAGGYQHTLVLKEDGTVWGFGQNDSGQLGNGTTAEQQLEPTQALLTQVSRIAAQLDAGFALRCDGTLWSFGYNGVGELGIGVVDDAHPNPIQILTDVKAISIGTSASLALKQDGSVWAWGWNYDGQADGGTEFQPTPTLRVPGGVKAISSGLTHEVIVKDDGSVWAWGSNRGGEVGNPPSFHPVIDPVRVGGLESNVIAVDAGGFYTLALKDDGAVWAWGNNTYGQLGDGTGVSKYSATQVPGLTNIVAISAGEDYASFALQADGTLWAWGRNRYGALGDGTTVDRLSPVQIRLATLTSSIEILTSTTRWKAQRGSEDIVIDIESAEELKVDEPLKVEVTGKAKDAEGKDVVTVPTFTLMLGATATSTAAPFRYQMKWTGPQLGADGELLPPSNYGLVVEAKKKADATALGSAEYDKVSLVEVTEIRFEPADGAPALDTNPAIAPLPGESAERGRSGGGRRVFPEALEPVASNRPAPKVFDAVQVIATLAPSVPDTRPDKPVRVFFRAIDVDDPSVGGGSIDDEGNDQDNRGDFDKGGNVLAGLFRAGQGATPDAAIGTALDKTAESTGAEASVTLRVSRRQGDNYRVAASTNEQWVSPAKLRALQKTDVSGKQGLAPGAVEHTTDEVLVEGRQVSEMLTVWRTLHLEVDRLVSEDKEADQARMDVRGNFTTLKEKSLEDETGPFRNDGKDADRQSLGHWVLHDRDNDWQGGELRVGFHSADPYNVTSNDKKSVDVEVKSDQPNLRNNLSEAHVDALADKSYVLRDDEIDSLERSADYRLATALFAKAYVQTALMPQSEQETRVPFVISRFHEFKERKTNPDAQLDRRNMMGDANYSLEAQGRSTAEYWSVQLVSAFEGNPESDFDPQEDFDIRTRTTTSKGNLGVTTLGSCFDGAILIGGCKPHASVFLETIRDLFAKPPRAFSDLATEGMVNQRATAHELLHTLNVTHGETIMCSNTLLRNGPEGGLVTERQLKTLRDLSQPTVSQSETQTCK